MASIDKRPNGRYLARWREYPGGPQKTKTFRRKTDAETHLDGIRGDLVRGVYVDPAAGKVTFRAFAEEWRALQPWRAGTAINAEQDLRLHVYPTIGDRPLSSIRPSHIQALVGNLTGTLAPSTLSRVYGRVAAVCRAAVRDRLIGFSPCVDIKLPRAPRSEEVTEVLTTEQVLALAAKLPARYGAWVIVAAGTGLRPGEMAGLAVDRVDFLRRSLRVDQQLVRVRGAGVAVGPLKTPSSYRTIPLGQTVTDALAAHLRERPAAGELRLVFTNQWGGPVQQHPFAVVFERAREAAKLPEWATPHDLRHYFASLQIRRGASVKRVQKLLGHASAKTTLDTYAHWWPDDEDSAREAVDAELAPRAEDSLRTEEAG